MNVKCFFAVSFLFLFGILYGQNNRVMYELRYRPSIDSNRVREVLYMLDIVEGKSVFRTLMRRTSDSLINTGNLGYAFPLSYNRELYLIKNLKEKEFNKILVDGITRTSFSLRITEPLSWKISTETKRIESLNCQKASTTYGGREWIAWFTPDIPIAEGPYYFHGLPGLIVSVEDVGQNFSFSLVKISEKANLYERKNFLQITESQFKKWQNDFYNDPFSFLKNRNIPVVTDNGSGGYEPMNFRNTTIQVQNDLKRENNTVEKNLIYIVN